LTTNRELVVAENELRTLQDTYSEKQDIWIKEKLDLQVSNCPFLILFAYFIRKDHPMALTWLYYALVSVLPDWGSSIFNLIYMFYNERQACGNSMSVSCPCILHPYNNF
jgi:hypothetical protein